MNLRQCFDLSAYLVIGPENTLGRSVTEIVGAALGNGFTFVQLRSKTAEARELISLAAGCAETIDELGLADKVPLIINDRLDVVLAAREQGIKVDGIHVGQQDIPATVCRKYLGEAAIVGLSAPTEELLAFIKKADLAGIDYLGAGPLHPTETKADCGRQTDGTVLTRSLEELRELAALSPLPVVVGGGVKCADLPALAKTKSAGFFVVSAVAGADNPGQAAAEMVNCWRKSTGMHI